jgi:hypothetical protein
MRKYVLIYHGVLGKHGQWNTVIKSTADRLADMEAERQVLVKNHGFNPTSLYIYRDVSLSEEDTE